MDGIPNDVRLQRRRHNVEKAKEATQAGAIFLNVFSVKCVHVEAGGWYISAPIKFLKNQVWVDSHVYLSFGGIIKYAATYYDSRDSAELHLNMYNNPDPSNCLIYPVEDEEYSILADYYADRGREWEADWCRIRATQRKRLNSIDYMQENLPTENGYFYTKEAANGRYPIAQPLEPQEQVNIIYPVAYYSRQEHHIMINAVRTIRGGIPAPTDPTSPDISLPPGDIQ